MRQAVDMHRSGVAPVAPARPTPPAAPVAAQRRATPAATVVPAATAGLVDGHGSSPRAQRTVGVDPVPAREELSTSAVLDRVDEMMGQLEERILEELERRGGRFTGYF